MPIVAGMAFGLLQAIAALSAVCVGLPMAIPMAITPVSPDSLMESGVTVLTMVTRVSEELCGLVSGEGGRPGMET